MLGSMGLAPNSAGGGFAAGNTAGAQGAYIRPLTGTRTAMKVDFSGALSQFLNQMSAHFNVSWEYTGGEIRVFRSVTRTFTVHALPSTIDLKSTLTADSTSSGGSGAQGGGATAGSNQKVNSAVTVEIWKDISGAVNTIVGSSGHVSTAVSTGTITVTAPPQIISRVQAYLDGQNERLNKQVAVSVQVLNVSVRDTDNYGFDLNAVFSRAGQYGLSLAGPAASVPATAGAFGFTVLSQKPVLGGDVSGSKAIIEALSTAGRVTVKTTASVTTLNGVPAPLQVANTRGYVQNVSVSDGTTTGGSGAAVSRTQLQTSTVTTGFSLSLLPRIDSESNGLLLQFGINISELNGPNDGFNDFSTKDGSTRVQLPNINSRNFVQQAFVPNGATLVLAGFEQTSNTGNRSGVGSPGFMGLGGNQGGSANRDMIVILMTPVVLSNTAPLITTD